MMATLCRIFPIIYALQSSPQHRQGSAHTGFLQRQNFRTDHRDHVPIGIIGMDILNAALMQPIAHLGKCITSLFLRHGSYLLSEKVPCHTTSRQNMYCALWSSYAHYITGDKPILFAQCRYPILLGLKLRQRLEHVLFDGFWIIIESGTDKPQSIRRQHLSVISSVTQTLIFFVLFIRKFVHQHSSIYKTSRVRARPKPLTKPKPLRRTNPLRSGNLKLY